MWVGFLFIGLLQPVVVGRWFCFCWMRYDQDGTAAGIVNSENIQQAGNHGEQGADFKSKIEIVVPRSQLVVESPGRICAPGGGHETL